jgi:CDP-diacylglycerol---serine O-phosphatidyltransferase
MLLSCAFQLCNIITGNGKMANKESTSKQRKRGIYLLPNVFTVAGLFAGFYAIVAATKHLYETAAIAILVALILDGLDGRIARLTHSTSDFGAQLDSLSDMVCFGITPALVLYMWSLHTLGKIGWLAAFFYAVCTALRLARFNSQQDQLEDKRYTHGLTTTLAAGFIASFLWVCTQYDITGVNISMFVLVITVIVAALKVSLIQYRSFKDFDMRGRVPFMIILAAVGVIVLISIDPPVVILIGFLTYMLSGPAGYLLKLFRPKS